MENKKIKSYEIVLFEKNSKGVCAMFVKRLSDGEVFYKNQDTNYGKICKFEEKDNLLFVSFNDSDLPHVGIEYLKPVLDYHIVKEYGVCSSSGDYYQIFCVRSLKDGRVFHLGQKTNFGIISKFTKSSPSILISVKGDDTPRYLMSDIKIIGDI